MAFDYLDQNSTDHPRDYHLHQPKSDGSCASSGRNTQDVTLFSRMPNRETLDASNKSDRHHAYPTAAEAL